MEANANAELKANATLTLAPTKSQSFLVLGLVVVGIAIFASISMFYLKEGLAGYAFLAFATCFAGMLFRSWDRSQRDADLDGARATQIQTSTGLSISTDVRVLNHPNGIEGFARLIELVQRQPLPVASGLVNNGQIIAGSEQEALVQTAKINAESQAAVTIALDNLSLSKSADVVSQEGLLYAPLSVQQDEELDANSAIQ